MARANRRPTVVDVAALAGVSIAAVSFVLNARDVEMRISEETRHKILEAVEALGYRPNASARELRTRRSHLLALSIHDIQNHFYSALAVAVQEEAAVAGYDVMIFNVGHRADRELAFLNTVLRRGVDGVITSALTVGAETLDPLVDADVPVVALSNVHTAFHPRVDYLVNDDARAAETAVRHLIELGHRRIGHLGGPRTLRVGRSRLEGYRAALAGAGLPIDPALEVEGTLTAHGSAEAGLLLVDARPRPTAIFSANDAMALQLHFAIKQRGLRMPDDIALVGFDDVREAAQVDPPLTTIANRSDEVGIQAVRLLLERMAMGRDQPGRIIQRPLPLITRESTLGRLAHDSPPNPAPAATVRAGSRRPRSASPPPADPSRKSAARRQRSH